MDFHKVLNSDIQLTFFLNKNLIPENHKGIDKLPNTRPYNYYLPDKDAFIQTEYLYIPDLDIYAYKKPNIAFKLPISHPNRERFEKDLDLLLGWGS